MLKKCLQQLQKSDGATVLGYIIAFVALLLFPLGIHIIAHGFFGSYGTHYPARMEILKSIGPLLSGVGTFGILTLALIKLPGEIAKHNAEIKRLSNEIEKQTIESKNERIESRDTKRAEAAALVMASVFKLIGEGQALDHLRNDWSFVGEGSTGAEDDRSEFAKMISLRLDNIRDDVKNFKDASIKARIFFDKDVVSILDEIENIWREIRGAINVLVHASYQSNSYQVRPKYEENFYDRDNKQRLRLKILEEKLFEILKPEVSVKQQNYLRG